MPSPSTALLAAAALFFGASIALNPAPAAPSSLRLHAERSSPLDLELSGEELREEGPAAPTRYLTRDDLLTLPQVTYTVTDDANFASPTEVSGVLLEDLARALAAAPGSALIVAVCSDDYHANYPHSYIAAHHPLLVLKINGQPPAGWPKDSETHHEDMGPYLISHAKFSPTFKIFSHADYPQIPWGVVRLEFRNEKTVFGAIAPRGPQAADPAVQAGYRIAQQNCFRCHNSGLEGGMKAGHPWLVLSAWAAASPQYFTDYVRHPQSRNPIAQMPGNPSYDDATIAALIAYFKTFQLPTEPQSSTPNKP
jgi:mono/diheme cytochrome c family protein